jgi:N-acetylglucosamine-6-phosphate deacetylase
VDDLWLAPGLIDLQVNGYQGLDFNSEDLTEDIVIELARRVLATGVTAFLPTIITGSEEKITACLRTIASAREREPWLRHIIPGVHIEGPHLSPEDGPRGAHPREHIRPPSMDEFDRWQQACGDLVRLVTISPHWPDAATYIRVLRERGVLVSLGHTNASVEQIHAAVDAGAMLSTHLGNGVAGTLPRHPNLLWAQMADDRLTAMLIADGHHLPADTLKVMLRAKGLNRIILTSDTVSLAGMPPGLYDTPVGGRVELTPEGRLCLPGTQLLAGSVTPLKDSVALLANTQLSLAEALQPATENPARVLGRTANLQVGSDADLIRFAWQPGAELSIESILLEGTPVDKKF